MNGSFLKNPARVHTAVTVLIVALAAAALLMLAIRPLQQKIRVLEQDLAIKNQQTERLARDIQNYKTAASELARVQDGGQMVRDIFPDREGMVRLVQGLERSAGLAGATLDLTIDDAEAADPAAGRTPLEPKKPLVAGLRDLEEVGYGVEIEGTFPQILGYLAFSENLPFFTEVGEITITADSAQISGGAATVNTGFGRAVLQGVFFVRSK